MTTPSDDELADRARRWLRNAYGGYRMRVYDRGVAYPEIDLISHHWLYLGRPDFVVTVVASHHSDLGESWPEMPWILPAEVKLLASIALSVPEGVGMLSFVPSKQQRVLDISDGGDLQDPQLAEIILSAAASLSLALVPPNERYELRASPVDAADQAVLWQSIRLDRPVLMRGLYCMLKSTHLFSSVMFGEEAFMNIQIAREAALQLVRDRIGPSASYAEAHDYIRQNFRYGVELAEFIEDQHNRWVATRHPRSRHGEFWTPPLLVDDYFETYGAVVSLFRHLLLGEHGRATAVI